MNFRINLTQFCISIIWDRNSRYNFHGSRSRAKVISFQPIPPFFLYSPFNLLLYLLPYSSLTPIPPISLLFFSFTSYRTSIRYILLLYLLYLISYSYPTPLPSILLLYVISLLIYFLYFLYILSLFSYSYPSSRSLILLLYLLTYSYTIYPILYLLTQSYCSCPTIILLLYPLT